MRNEDKLPKSHPALKSVNPEHLAFAFHVACGVLTTHLQPVNPREQKVSLETAPGDVSEITFADNPFSRVMFTVQRELRAFYPANDPASSQAASGIVFRVTAMPQMLGKDGVFEIIEGKFALGPKAVLAFATAPLSRHTGRFKRKTFLRHFAQVNPTEEYASLRIELPAEMIVESEAEPSPSRSNSE